MASAIDMTAMHFVSRNIFIGAKVRIKVKSDIKHGQKK